VNVNNIKSVIKVQGLTTGLLAGVLSAAALVLAGCAEEPSPWTKSSSPWERSQSQAEAPAAESYKADLEMQEESEPETNSEVELSYQAEPVESFVPEPEPEQAAYAEPEPEVSYEPAAATTGGGSSIRDQPANYYTVQLMASVDIDRVYRFAEENQISTEFVVPTLRDGVTWHVLLLGIYEDYAAASASKNEVAPLLKTEPWIRSVGSVQKLMQ